MFPGPPSSGCCSRAATERSLFSPVSTLRPGRPAQRRLALQRQRDPNAWPDPERGGGRRPSELAEAVIAGSRVLNGGLEPGKEGVKSSRCFCCVEDRRRKGCTRVACRRVRVGRDLSREREGVKERARSGLQRSESTRGSAAARRARATKATRVSSDGSCSAAAERCLTKEIGEMRNPPAGRIAVLQY
jgi:hypothetical protein